MKRSKNYLDVFSLMFITLSILAILNSIFILGNTSQVFWLCYIGLLIIGIGIYRRSSFIIVSQLNILLIPLLIWNIDFFYQLLVGNSLFGISEYIFAPGWTLGRIISLQHIITLPIAIFCAYIIGLKSNDSWKISLIEIFIFYFLTLFLTKPSQNINCVFEPCGPFAVTQGYPLIWFALFALIILLTNYILSKLLKKSK